MKPVHLFIWLAVAMAFAGYLLLAMGANRGHYGICGFWGSFFGIMALIIAIKDARGIKFPKVTHDE